MRIDLTCPVEVWSCHIPTPENPFCTLQMYNLSQEDVSSLQVAILAFDREGTQVSRHVERVLTPEAKAQHVFELSVQDEDDVYADNLEILIEKVWFAEGAQWRRGVAEMTEYTPEKPLKGDRLKVMQTLAGPDASRLPSDQGNVWICVCSRVNAGGSDHCARCGRDRHDVFTKLNKAKLEEIILVRRSKQEEEELAARTKQRLDEEKKAEERRRKKRRRRIIRNTVISAVAAAVLFAAVWFFGIPYYRYMRASQALENGQYASAREQFVALADYGDSAEMVLECDYQSALSNLKYGTYNSLASSRDTFLALGDYKDSALRAREAAYTRGEKFFAASRWEEAAEMYGQVAGYSDASDKRVRAVYAWAGELLKAGEYADAREKYLSVSHYQDAAEMAKECLYQPALKLLEGEQPLEALDAFSVSELDGYKDTERRRLEACYMAGESWFAKGEYDAAAEYYAMAGDYSDALRKLKQCLYDPAMEDMDRGEYLAAAEKLEQILAFDDARAQWETCIMNLGQQAMAQEDYAGAADWFSRISDDNVLADTLLNQCVYHMAMKAFEEGDMETAEKYFAEIPGYQDADSYRYGILYERARGYIAKKSYEEARPILEELGNYEDSEEDLRFVRYSLAADALEQGRYEDAVFLFDQVGDYKDAPDQMDHARYLMALDLKNAQQWQKASDLFKAILTYADSSDQYDQCMYELASEALDTGDTEKAVSSLAGIRDYRDAENLFCATVYSGALTYRSNGEYARAADWFLKIPDYQDSAAQAEECLDLYYSISYDEAMAAYRSKDYAQVVAILKGMDLSNLPERYSDLADVYPASAYQAAEALYSAKRPYEALPYYRLIPDYRDVSSKKLARTCYAILGVWVTEKDESMEFREDGTCTVLGNDFYYYVTQYAIYLGTEDDPAKMEYTYNIFSRNDTAMTLKHDRSNTLYRLVRAGEDADE